MMKWDSVSVSQGSPASLAMNALLDLKETNATNAHQNFLDTQIVKVCKKTLKIIKNVIKN